MPDSKITALTNLTAADAINDMFPIVDVSDNFITASGTTKRISINNLLSSSPTASGALTVTGLVTAGSATITGALTVDTTTLVVDATNDRVGVNTATFDTNWGPKLQTSSTSTDGSGGIVIESYKPNLILKDASSGAQRRHIYADGGVQYFGYGDASIAEHLSIGTTGNVSVALGNVVMATSGKGIDFSAVTGGTGTATGNVLNDYEEGTWTPAYSPTTGAFTTLPTVSSGQYRKIGNTVFVWGNLRTAGTVVLGAASGDIQITGLPFTCSTASGYGTSSVFQQFNLASSSARLGIAITASTTIATITKNLSNAGASYVQANELSTATGNFENLIGFFAMYTV